MERYDRFVAIDNALRAEENYDDELDMDMILDARKLVIRIASDIKNELYWLREAAEEKAKEEARAGKE